jgi:hypothetical protein
MYNVIRTFGVDYIYFDLIFVSIFLFLLIKYKKIIPLIAFFVGGFCINFLVDWGLWLHTGIRELTIPANFVGGAFLFMLWFSLSYGVEYAYVFLMFQEKAKKYEKLAWTLFILIGWLLVGFLSQKLHINDTQIVTLRHMSDFRLLRVALVLFGYGLLVYLKYDWKKIAFLFFVGFMVHFMMELSLLLTSIRPGSLAILIENSLLSKLK